MYNAAYIIYRVLEEYKQIMGYDKFKSVINPDEFRTWLYNEYGAVWHPGNPDYLNFSDELARTAFMLKWSE